MMHQSLNIVRKSSILKRHIGAFFFCQKYYNFVDRPLKLGSFEPMHQDINSLSLVSKLKIVKLLHIFLVKKVYEYTYMFELSSHNISCLSLFIKNLMYVSVNEEESILNESPSCFLDSSYTIWISISLTGEVALQHEHMSMYSLCRN